MAKTFCDRQSNQSNKNQIKQFIRKYNILAMVLSMRINTLQYFTVSSKMKIQLTDIMK